MRIHPSPFTVAVDEFIAEQKGLLLSKHCENHPSDLPVDDASTNKRPKSPLDWLSKVHIYYDIFDSIFFFVYFSLSSHIMFISIGKHEF